MTSYNFLDLMSNKVIQRSYGYFHKYSYFDFGENESSNYGQHCTRKSKKLTSNVEHCYWIMAKLGALHLVIDSKRNKGLLEDLQLVIRSL
jgi:hypothetical protein